VCLSPELEYASLLNFSNLLRSIPIHKKKTRINNVRSSIDLQAVTNSCLKTYGLLFSARLYKVAEKTFYRCITQTMDTFHYIQNELYSAIRDISELLENAASVSESCRISFEDLARSCEDIRRQIDEGILRVAVIGSIKSGKSTFTNYLFHGDYLKRSAGVVTSIVTRIMRGDSIRARVFFKSWAEINNDMRQAMILMPFLEYNPGGEAFDIRKEECRTALKEAIESLNSSMLVSGDTRNPQIVLLSSYLKGYDRVRDIIREDNAEVVFRERRFAEHRAFVSDDACAVFLKDIQLEINTGLVDRNIEIADCQGSDSPNPLHLNMIRDYLFYTNLNIYVISSRTGVRQADVRFLSIIKKMGIMDNVIFIVNCDFNEHDSLQDLNRLTDKIREDLSMFTDRPELYTLSALFNLFRTVNSNPSSKHTLTEKELVRLRQWEEETELSEFLDRQTELFETSFKKKLGRERYSLLLRNHIERLLLIVSTIRNQADINLKILKQDALSAKKIMEELRLNNERMDKLKLLIKKTMSAMSEDIKEETRSRVDRFFSPRSETVIADFLEYIENQHVSYEKYEDSFSLNGFSHTLYLVFHDFKARVDSFTAERLGPEIVKFVKDTEEYIQESFRSASYPYVSMIEDYLEKYNTQLESIGINVNEQMNDGTEQGLEPDLAFIKATGKIVLPSAVVSMDFSSRIRAEAFMHLGFYSLRRVMKKILKKNERDGNEWRLALKKAVRQIAKEAEKSVVSCFINYAENLKFQYFFRLIDLINENYYDILCRQLSAKITEYPHSTALIEGHQSLKDKAVKGLEEVKKAAEQIGLRIEGIKGRASAL